MRKFDEHWKRYQASQQIMRLRLSRPQERDDEDTPSANGHERLEDPEQVKRLLDGTPDPNPSAETIASRNRSVGMRNN